MRNNELWYSAKKLHDVDSVDLIVPEIVSGLYTGVIFGKEDLGFLDHFKKSNLKMVLTVDTSDEYDELFKKEELQPIKDKAIINSKNLKFLSSLVNENIATCYRATANNESSLIKAIKNAEPHDYILIDFSDPTNIPLELVIAKLQKKTTKIIKLIEDEEDLDDATVVYGVMEVGADGAAYSPTKAQHFRHIETHLSQMNFPDLNIQEGTIISTKAIGLGYRSCLDLATLFKPSEGMLVGSTSQGGILCCPEVFYLPYMELRPFRVNAGGIHSYVYNVNDTTNYMSELKAGDSVMVVDLDGKVRTAPIGRVKTEIRPLRLIEVEFSSGEEVNVIMQDDWHVRIFSSAGLPMNITELNPGDKILGYTTEPGRHVGVKVDEHIIEK